MQYRLFLEKAELEQLREGRGGYRLVGEGLIVPHVDPEEWEEVMREKRSPDVNLVVNTKAGAMAHQGGVRWKF